MPATRISSTATCRARSTCRCARSAPTRAIPEVAGNLAFLLLKVAALAGESARQLAVHAIALAAAQRTGRSDDWTTLADRETR
jgi:hypothetical protein